MADEVEGRLLYYAVSQDHPDVVTLQLEHGAGRVNEAGKLEF